MLKRERLVSSEALSGKTGRCTTFSRHAILHLGIDRRNERSDERIYECIDERIDERFNECIDESINE